MTHTPPPGPPEHGGDENGSDAQTPTPSNSPGGGSHPYYGDGGGYYYNNQSTDSVGGGTTTAGAASNGTLTPGGTSSAGGMNDSYYTAGATPGSPTRETVGHVGLINQGCTCYLNSLLQTLFHLSYFRAAVYKMSTEESDQSHIPKALQELYFQMQERSNAPTTKGLTEAFGWTEREVFEQHDIQEMAALLRDNLEEKMKGTPSEGAITRIFEGLGESFVTTTDGSYTSTRKEPFFDIHLPISKYPNIYDSLKSLFAKEDLNGDNKYKVEEEGKPAVYKDAVKGYRVVKFPPVIMFHLKRFEMDLYSPTLEMKKINSAFEFPDQLNLGEYEDGTAAEIDKSLNARRETRGGEEEGGCGEEEDSNPDAFSRYSQPVYDLHSVIVHKGGVRSGHYYCYIREFDTETGHYGRWIEFDDEHVRVVPDDVAIDRNFGGFTRTAYQGREFTVPSTHNAYILVYVRRQDAPKVLCPITTNIIPQRVKDELTRLLVEDERKAKIAAEAKLYCNVTLVTDDTIRKYVAENTVELISPDEKRQADNAITLNVRKSTRYVDFLLDVAQRMKLKNPSDVQLFSWSYLYPDQVASYRPTNLLDIYTDVEPEKTVEDVFKALVGDGNLLKAWNVLLYVQTKKKLVPPLEINAAKNAKIEVSSIGTFANEPDREYEPKALIQPNLQQKTFKFGAEDEPEVWLDLTEPTVVTKVAFRIHSGKNPPRRNVEVQVYLYPDSAAEDKGQMLASDTRTVVLDPQQPPKIVHFAFFDKYFGKVAGSSKMIKTPPKAKVIHIKIRQLGVARNIIVSRLQVGIPPELAPIVSESKKEAFVTFNPSRSGIVFLKYFNYRTGKITYLGSTVIDLMEPLARNTPTFLQMLGQSPEHAISARLRVYDESLPYEICEVDMNATPDDSSLTSGNVLTLQAAPETISLVHRFITADQFYNHVRNTRTVTVRNYKDPKNQIYSLNMVGTWGYDEICDQIALKLGCDGEYLRLYGSTSCYEPSPKIEAERTTTGRSLDDMLTVSSWAGHDLFFEQLSVTRKEAEALISGTVQFAELLGTPIGQPVNLSLPPKSTTWDVIHSILGANGIENVQSKPFVLLEIHNCRIRRSFPVVPGSAEKRYNMDNLPPRLDPHYHYEVREFVPPAPGEFSYYCCHVDRSNQYYQNAAFGSPFIANFPEADDIHTVKDKLLELTGVPLSETDDDLFTVMMYVQMPLNFPKWDDPVRLYWVHTENRTGHDPSIILNHKRPKEKPGSRYVASNEPKLSLEKKKRNSTGDNNQSPSTSNAALDTMARQ